MSVALWGTIRIQWRHRHSPLEVVFYRVSFDGHFKSQTLQNQCINCKWKRVTVCTRICLFVPFCYVGLKRSLKPCWCLENFGLENQPLLNILAINVLNIMVKTVMQIMYFMRASTDWTLHRRKWRNGLIPLPYHQYFGVHKINYYIRHKWASSHWSSC